MSSRPFWSVMIPCYNPEPRYLRETLQSVLQHGFPEAAMQIEVIDNCSTTVDVEALVREVGQGRVTFSRNPSNLGMVGNWNRCIERARGEVIHLLHADDYVLPGFYFALQEAFIQNPEAAVVFCAAKRIDGEGRYLFTERLTGFSGRLDRISWMRLIAQKCHVATPSVAVRRQAYLTAGGYRDDVGSASDWEMWVRLSSDFTFCYVPQELACYRYHSSNTSWDYSREGRDIESACKVLEIARERMPLDVLPQELYENVRAFHGLWALQLARMWFYVRGEAKAGMALMKQALRCSRRSEVMAAMTELVASYNPAIKLELTESEFLFGSPDSLLQKALALHQAGRYAEAQALCDYFLLSHPGRADAWTLLGLAHWRGGDKAKAEAALRQALTLRPDYSDAQRYLRELAA